MRETYGEMTRIIEKEHGLRMPDWWRSNFPARR
jgi:hypothetical protein